MVLVHAHVSLAAALASIRATEIVGVVAVPWCALRAGRSAPCRWLTRLCAVRSCNFGNVQSAIQSWCVAATRPSALSALTHPSCLLHQRPRPRVP